MSIPLLVALGNHGVINHGLGGQLWENLMVILG